MCWCVCTCNHMHQMEKTALIPNSMLRLCSARPILKSCSFPIHQPGEINNNHELPAGRIFFFAISLSKKESIIPELQNQVMHYDVTNQVTDSKTLFFKIFQVSNLM